MIISVFLAIRTRSCFQCSKIDLKHRKWNRIYLLCASFTILIIHQDISTLDSTNSFRLTYPNIIHLVSAVLRPYFAVCKWLDTRLFDRLGAVINCVQRDKIRPLPNISFTTIYNHKLYETTSDVIRILAVVGLGINLMSGSWAKPYPSYATRTGKSISLEYQIVSRLIKKKFISISKKKWIIY